MQSKTSMYRISCGYELLTDYSHILIPDEANKLKI